MRTLAPLEHRVMDALWQQPDGSGTVRDLAAQLSEYAYTTIATVLDRLAEKELVVILRDGRLRRYVAAENPAVHTTLLMQEALAATHDPAGALECFVQSATMEQVAALQSAVNRRTRAASRKARKQSRPIRAS